MPTHSARGWPGPSRACPTPPLRPCLPSRPRQASPTKPSSCSPFRASSWPRSSRGPCLSLPRCVGPAGPQCHSKNTQNPGTSVLRANETLGGSLGQGRPRSRPPHPHPLPCSQQNDDGSTHEKLDFKLHFSCTSYLITTPCYRCVSLFHPHHPPPRQVLWRGQPGPPTFMPCEAVHSPQKVRAEACTGTSVRYPARVQRRKSGSDVLAARAAHTTGLATQQQMRPLPVGRLGSEVMVWCAGPSEASLLPVSSCGRPLLCVCVLISSWEDPSDLILP